MNDQALIVFTRIPEAGKTKTRLMPFLTGDECEGLQMAFLQDWREKLKGISADVYVAYTGGGSREEEFMNLFADANFFLQADTDIWIRMYQAMEFVFCEGYQRCVLIGTDAPCGTKADLEQAFCMLKEKDYVLGPTEDGSYWMIGAHAEDRMLKSLFSPVISGANTVLTDTLQMIPRWKKYALLEERYDIDTIEDLLLFRDVADGFAASYLREHHVISVIVPLFNNAESLPGFLRNLEKLKNRAEVIFVDGGSTDGSTDIIRAASKDLACRIRLTRSQRNRGMQLNAGAEAANGDVLFFLPMNTGLPDDPISEILSLIQSHDAGCFGTETKNRGILQWRNRKSVNRRMEQGILSERQGIVIRRDVFMNSGMFSEDANQGEESLVLILQDMQTPIGKTKHPLCRQD